MLITETVLRAIKQLVDSGVGINGVYVEDHDHLDLSDDEVGYIYVSYLDENIYIERDSKLNDNDVSRHVFNLYRKMLKVSL